MAEYLTTRYKRLFEIRLLHHYWLDDGATVFDLIAPQKSRDQRLLSYDLRPFLAVAPTTATAKALQGLGGVYKNTALGGLVAVPDTAVVPLDARFDFVVTVQNSAFFNYTALTLRPQKIFEIYYQPEKKIYRYKENVPVLSNLTGAARGSGQNQALFLSREFPLLVDDDQVESLVLVGTALMQLTSDQPLAGQQILSDPATELPIFVHQGDVPKIVPPPGLVGAPLRGLMLSEDIPDHVFALVRLSAIRPDDEHFSFIDGGGQAKPLTPVFQVRFKNRSTIWQYINKNTGGEDPSKPGPLPLTRFGNAGTKQKPSEGLVKVVTSGNQVTQLVSEIFV